MKRLLSLALLVTTLALTAISADAQSPYPGVAAAIAAVTPSNNDQCLTVYQSPLVDLYGRPSTSQAFASKPNIYNYLQQGFCTFHVVWNAPLPQDLYAISCTPESGNSAGYLTLPFILNRTATGFDLNITYHLNNTLTYDIEILPGGGGATYPTPYDVIGKFQPGDLGTMYVDCIAKQ